MECAVSLMDSGMRRLPFVFFVSFVFFVPSW